MNTPLQRCRQFPIIGKNACGKFQSLEIFALAALCAAMLLSGCSTVPAQKTGAVHRVWPPPPASPRIAYVESIGGPADLGARVSTWRKLANLVTGSDRGLEPFVRPQAVAVDENGNLCVADPGAGAVGFFDRQRKKYFRWTRIGKEPFASPVSIAKRGDLIFVADTGLGKIIAFDGRGRLALSITNGIGRPAGIAVSSNRLFVADAVSNCVLVFDFQGVLLSRLGDRGTGAGTFNGPTHVSLDSAGRIYVSDSLNFRVQVLDADGKALSAFGTVGDGSGHFGRPKGVAADSYGHVYVVDALFDNVQAFDRSGRFLLNWGEAGSEPGEFWLPAGIAIDKENRMFVADSYNCRVQVFNYVGQE